MDGAKEVRGSGQVFQRQVEEQALARFPLGGLLGNRLVIKLRVSNRMIEDRRVGCESGDGEVAQVAFQSAAFQQSASNIVEPQALTDLVKLFRGIHDDSFSVEFLSHSV